MSDMLTGVRLCAVPLENDYKHTLYFETKSAQETYFLGKTRHSVSECSYQRKDNVLRYPACMDDIINCNYVMYRNNAHSSKWYFAFITNMEYKNDEMTLLTIETDAIQTWLFDYNFKPSFIEREHVDSDVAGEHTIPEGLDTGEYICNAEHVCDALQDKCLVMGCTLDINNYTGQAGDWNMTKEFAPAYGDMYTGLYSGLKYFVVTPEQLKTVMKHIAYEGQEDAVHVLFYAPTRCVETEDSGTYALEVKPKLSPLNFSWQCCEKPTTLDGYTPRNNKLLTAPYHYLLVDNGGGTSVEYMYEKFDNVEDKVSFSVLATLTAGMSIRAIPTQYNGLMSNHAEGINLSKFATCSWVSDAYTSWLTQSAVNVGLSTAGAIAGTVGSLALAPATAGGSLVVGASVIGGVLGISSSLANANTRLSTPPQLHGNVNSGDVMTASNSVTFRAFEMSIKEEYAKIIDSFFDMYGYKVNRVGVPKFLHRKNFWYTKTIDANIDGEIPLKDLQTIKKCYNNGITFWSNPANIGNYNVENVIIG